MAKGIFAALEDLEDNADTVDIIDPGEQAHDENLRRETTDDVEMSSDQIGEMTGTIDQTENAVDDLMAIGDSLSTDSEMPGIGIDEVSIKPTMLAVEGLYRKLGIQNPVLPSLEAFSNPRSSKMAVEQLKVSIEEKAEEAKSGIKKVMAKIWEFIKNLYNKVIDSFKRLFRPSITTLLKKLSDLKATEPKEKTVKDGRLVKAFGEPGKDASKSDVREGVAKLVSLLEVFHVEGSKTVNNLPFDTTIDIKVEGEDKVSVEIKSGWDGKEAGDKTIELSSKSECIEILKMMSGFQNIIEKGLKDADGLIKKSLQLAKAAKEDEEVKKLEKQSKVAQKVTPKALAIFTKTINAGIDYCNKSYKEIKANEGGKEEKGNKEEK